MMCPKCGAPSHVLETRQGAHFTTTRRRQCDAVKAHRFTSVEMHGAAASQAPTRKTAASMQRRIGTWRRDIDIARELYQGAPTLAERYGLKVVSIYAAAARGRRALAALRQ